MNAERQAFPVDPFSYSEPRFLYLAPAIGGRVYCHCFPAKSLPKLCSRECGMAPGFTAACFIVFPCLLLLSPRGTGSVLPTGIVEAPGGRALETPVQ